MNSDNEYDRLCGFLKAVCGFSDTAPEAAVVLGSGLGDFAQCIDVKTVIPYRKIPGFPISTAPGHDGCFIMGNCHNKSIVAMKGRIHFYEGYTVNDVVAPIRLIAMMGAKTLLLSNASGGIRNDLVPGDLMLITDHISVFAPNPLIGRNIEKLGVRFPDMSEVYDKKLCNIIKECAKNKNVSLKSGVYAQLTGPSYETPSEIKMLSAMGADAIGMSTVVEAIAAKHAGMKVCGISCVTNMAAGRSEKPLSHLDVLETSARVKSDFNALVKASIQRF